MTPAKTALRTVAVVTLVATIGCGPVAPSNGDKSSAPVATASGADTSSSIKEGEFDGKTSSGGRVQLIIAPINPTRIMQVESGSIELGAARCAGPNGVETQFEPVLLLSITPATIDHSRFEVDESNVEAGGYRVNLTIIGVFTSPADASGTAVVSVVAAEPPNAVCTVAPASVTWAAKFLM